MTGIVFSPGWEGLMKSPSLVIRRTQSEANLHKRGPIFIPDISGPLLSENSTLTQPSASINCQLDIKLEKAASEEIHLESSSHLVSDWDATTWDRILDDDNHDDLNPMVAKFYSKLGDMDILRESYLFIIEEQKMLLEEQKLRARFGLGLDAKDEEWLAGSHVRKQTLLEELQELGDEVYTLELQCFGPGLIDGDGNPIQLAPIQTLVEEQAPDKNFYDAVDTHTVISRWLSPSSTTTRTPPPSTFNHRRKAVRVFLNGEECIACPDSGSDRDIMSEVFAEQHGFNIRRTETDKEWFKMGNGKACRSIGRVRASCTLLEESTFEWRWFHVLAKCAIPLIVGMSFIQEAEIFTCQKHLLTDYPPNIMAMPTLKLIGSPQSWISFAADGSFLVGCADTGSDLDFMSFDCATERGFKIDTRESARTCVMLPDCTIVETLGIVHITSFEIAVFDGSRMTYQVLPGLPNGLCEDLEMDFHVLPDMTCDVIFGEEFLELKDAFKTCSQIIHSKDPSSQNLNILINLGKVQAFLGRKLKTNPSDTASRDHDDKVNAEMYRRSKARRIISKMEDGEQAVAAEKSEVDKVKAFDEAHAKCVHCVGEKTEGPAVTAADKVLDDTPRWSREF